MRVDRSSLALILFLAIAPLSAQDRNGPSEVGDLTTREEASTDRASNDRTEPEPDQTDSRSSSEFHGRDFLYMLAENRSNRVALDFDFGIYALPLPDESYDWASALSISTEATLTSGEFSLTAWPEYALNYGAIPGVPERNELRLRRLFGSLFFSKSSFMQVGLVNWDQGPKTDFNPFAWSKNPEFLSVTKDYAPSRLGIAFQSPHLRAYYAFDPDFLNFMGGISLHSFSHDLLSAGLVLERLETSVNRLGAYAVSSQKGAVFLEESLATVFYFDDALNQWIPELDAVLSLSIDKLSFEVGYYLNGRRISLLPDPSIEDPHGYLTGKQYLHGRVFYHSGYFMLFTHFYANLDDGSLLAIPSFQYRRDMSGFTATVSADFPLAFGNPDSEMLLFMPSTFCAVLKLSLRFFHSWS